MSSSSARAAASLFDDDPADEAAVDAGAPEPEAGSRLHADMSGSVAAADASLAMAWRRVNEESGKGCSH